MAATPSPRPRQTDGARCCRGGRAPLLLVTALSFLTAVAWSFTVPVFEAPDEPAHWEYARFVHDHGRLPRYDSTYIEGAQAPLYYALIAGVARPGERPPVVNWLRAGRPEMPFAPRLFMNAGDDGRRYWPVRLARLLTCVMMVGAVWFSSVAACNAAGSPTAGLLAAAFVGFLPQFTFRAGSVNNDTLAATLSAAVTALLVGYLGRGASTRGAVLAGVCLGAAYLAKINAVCLVPGVLIAAAVGDGPPRRRLGHAAIVMGVAGLLVLPWSLRNLALYGDPFATGAMYDAVPALISEKTLSSSFFYQDFPVTLATSFVGNFGWMNLPLPTWVYRVFLVLMLAGAAGLAVGVFRHRIHRRVVLVLLTIALASLAVVVRFNLSQDQPQGRYLFPAVPAIGVLWAMGVAHLLGSGRNGQLLSWATVALLAGLNAFALVAVVRPAYYPPVVPKLSRAVRELHPTGTSGLAQEASGWWRWRVGAAEPWLEFQTDAVASEFGFLQFVIEGESVVEGVSPQVRHPWRVRATVSFSVGNGPATGGGAVRVPWMPDGRARTVVIPLLKDAGWRGRVYQLRLAPFEAGRNTAVGRRFRISGVELRGSPVPVETAYDPI